MARPEVAATIKVRDDADFCQVGAIEAGEILGLFLEVRLTCYWPVSSG